MSRIGKQPIAIPPKVKVEVKGQRVQVEGPKGKLDWELPRRTSLKVENGKVVPGAVKAKFSSSGDGPLWITARGAYIDKENTLRLSYSNMPVPRIEEGIRRLARAVRGMMGSGAHPLEREAAVGRQTGDRNQI